MKPPASPGAPEATAVHGRASRIALLILAGGLILLLLIPFISNAGDEMVALKAWIRSLGVLGPLAFVAATVILTSVFVPSSLLSTTAGALFGLGWGSVMMSLAMIIAAALDYMAANQLLQKRITKFLDHHPKLSAIDKAVQRKGLRFQFTLRLAPLSAVTINYVLGAAGVRFPTYMMATLGLIPGIFAEVYFGHVATHLSTVTAGASSHSTAHTVLTVAGFLVVAGVMLYIGRTAKRAIEQAETNS